MNLRYTLLIALFSATISFAQNEFITVWETTTADESITIPTATDATYNYSVDWGDGSAVESGQTGDATHSYATAGNYDVTITGTFPRIYFNNRGDRTKILEVKQWGSQAWTSMEQAFAGCSKLNITATDVPDLTAVRSMKGMFQSSLLETANRINDWNTGSVTNMDFVFAYTTVFNQNINSWDTNKVTSMNRMFSGATAFNQDLSGWKTGAVTQMLSLFSNASKFNQDISGWDTGRVNNMFSLFYAAFAFDQDLSGWDISAVTNMTEMFTGVTLSTANYDSMLDSWSKQAVRSNVPFDGGNSKYCDLGEAGRAVLEGEGWSFSDGGKDTEIICGTLGTSESAYNPWAIYPNPVKNRVYVSGSTVPKRIEVFGIDGRKLLDESDVDNVGVEQLNNGMYLVKLSASNGSSQVFKLIKE